MNALADRFANQAWSKAMRILAEAEAQNPESTPNSVAHSAYYPMFHAARAVLLHISGSAPKKHGNVVGQFGLAMKDRGETFRNAGDDFKSVYSLRLRADYDVAAFVSRESASQSVLKARVFIDLCATEFGFPRQQGDDDG